MKAPTRFKTQFTEETEEQYKMVVDMKESHERNVQYLQVVFRMTFVFAVVLVHKAQNRPEDAQMDIAIFIWQMYPNMNETQKHLYAYVLIGIFKKMVEKLAPEVESKEERTINIFEYEELIWDIVIQHIQMNKPPAFIQHNDYINMTQRAHLFRDGMHAQDVASVIQDTLQKLNGGNTEKLVGQKIDECEYFFTINKEESLPSKISFKKRIAFKVMTWIVSVFDVLTGSISTAWLYKNITKNEYRK